MDYYLLIVTASDSTEGIQITQVLTTKLDSEANRLAHPDLISFPAEMNSNSCLSCRKKVMNSLEKVEPLVSIRRCCMRTFPLIQLRMPTLSRTRNRKRPVLRLFCKLLPNVPSTQQTKPENLAGPSRPIRWVYVIALLAYMKYLYTCE